MILADTSVWIHHFRYNSPALQSALHQGIVVVHPDVLGELACGNFRRREHVLRSLSELPRPKTASHHECLTFIDAHKLWGLGIGWIDVHLLASALLTPCRLWTLDRRLRQAAAKSGAALYQP